jgi:hypothetical protein
LWIQSLLKPLTNVFNYVPHLIEQVASYKFSLLLPIKK